jgi:hypothetical protein
MKALIVQTPSHMPSALFFCVVLTPSSMGRSLRERGFIGLWLSRVRCEPYQKNVGQIIESYCEIFHFDA